MDTDTMDQLDAWRKKRTMSTRTRAISTKWIQIQHKTFAKWVSERSGTEISNFRIDFVDGVVLLKLMETLSGKRVRRSHSQPASLSQRCDNIQLALDICKSEGVKLTNIGTQDIAGGSLKLMLGLVWCLIQRYHLISLQQLEDVRRNSLEKENSQSLKAKVVSGLSKILDNVKLRVNNLKSDWTDGMALTALVTYLAPMFNIDFMNIERDDYVDATHAAMQAASEHLNIPCLLSADDFISVDVDELSMITYLSYFLNPEHLSVREQYIAEHDDYTPAYKISVEEEPPPNEEEVKKAELVEVKENLNPVNMSEAKKSPVKKLLTFGRSQFQGIKLKSRKKGKESDGQADQKEDTILGNDQPTEGHDCHKKTARRTESESTLVEWEDSLGEITAISPTEETSQEMTDQETQEILEKILNASDDELLDDPGDTFEPMTRSRCSTTANRARRSFIRKPATKVSSELQPFFRDHELFAEYKLLCSNVPSGVYVVPSFKTLQIWHGMIFLKIGMFAGGCFKFNLYIPDNFPYARPSLIFSTPVFHPQVKTNGEMNLTKAFPTWTPRKDRIWHVLRYTKRCFFSVNTFEATNTEAAESVHESVEAFKNKARWCVENSIKVNSDQSEDQDDDNVFNVCLRSDEEVVRIKESIVQSQKCGFAA